MYEKSCASSNHIKSWKDIDFGTAEYEVKKLQMRIAKAVKENRVGKIKSLQWTLTHSFYAKAIAVKRVTENKGKRTPGVDGVCWISKGKLNATDQGTPQGGTISPTLCNYVLDGLERLLKNKFKRYWSKGRQINPKVNLVRYADDFIITGASEELLRNEVLPLVKEFMHERGLELSDEKTVITNIHDGFDFLGCNIRKYGDKLLTKPSKQNVKSIMRKIRGTIKKFRTGKQSDLIKCLNPIIRGWVNFQKYNVSSVAFRYVDWQTFKALWRWCRRRHKNKPAAWIRDKYFHRIGNRSWTFSEKLTEDNYLALVYATDTNITRFTRIKAEANPYDEIWMEYFAERKNKSYSNFKFVYE